MLCLNYYLHGKSSWKEFFRSIPVDLPKAYDCLQNDLLLAKLQAYGFSKESVSCS